MKPTKAQQLKILKRMLYFTVLWEPDCGNLPPDDVIEKSLKKFTKEEIIQKLREPDEVVNDFGTTDVTL
jgi:hypothetical protein